MKTSNYLAKLPQEATIKSIQVLKDYDLITLDVPTASQRLCANVKHFFTLLGKMFFTSYGKEFFTYLGKQIFTSQFLPAGTGQGASAGRIPRGKSNTWHGAGSGPALQW